MFFTNYCSTLRVIMNATQMRSKQDTHNTLADIGSSISIAKKLFYLFGMIQVRSNQPFSENCTFWHVIFFEILHSPARTPLFKRLVTGLWLIDKG